IADSTVYAVGDVVTHNLQKKGITPEIAVVDGYTMRLPCKKLPVFRGECIRVKNPAGTVTDELIRALDYAVLHQPATIIVEGEEDLAVIPMVIAAEAGAVVLYGQPNEGVVVRTVTREAQETARHFLTHFIREER
ncbi:MAG: GTP-dependent dephospho-CoA kinase family protein, partial [Methanoregula sp.]|nr:GTP-dependent dephospho-CoA kinase family protein [Methanoregula sp.]